MALEAHHGTGAHADGGHRVSLAIPCRPEYAALCRLTVAGIANLQGLDQETVADLKVAVTEACSLFMRFAESGGEAPPGAARFAESGGEAPLVDAPEPVIRLEFSITDDSWVIQVCAGQGSSPAHPLVHPTAETELGLSVIRALLDRVELLAESDGGFSLTLVKQV